ncbi:MAG: NAD-dependent epimerase/dehydratase family protein [Ilumatobacteraceae bacterium]
MDSALVVGGGGFLGSHLTDRLLAEGVAVDVVDDLSTGSLANLGPARNLGAALKIHHLDASTPEFATLVGLRAPDVIYHLSAVPRSDDASSLTRAFASTAAIIEAARVHRVTKLVVAVPGTVLYGNPAARDLPVKEAELRPRGLRGVLARAVVESCSVVRESAAVEFTALALSSVYGPRQRPDGGVVAAFLAAASEGRAPIVSGDGRQTRDFLFVDDAGDALVRAGDRGSGLLLNVGTGQQTSILDLWASIPGSSSILPERSPVRSGELSRFALSPVRARIHLGWSPWTDLSDGLAQSR